MRYENVNGHTIVCGHIFPRDEIKIGTRWMGLSGHIVTVQDIKTYPVRNPSKDDKPWVDIIYWWYDADGKKVTHDKDFFAFQCRYCLIVDSPEPVNK